MDPLPTPIVTLAERRLREAERRRTAALAMVCDMADYARLEGGRFLLFGSAAAGTLGARSDLDVMADFPPATEAAALAFVEDLAARHSLPLDLHTVGTSTPAFLEAIGPGVRVLS